MNNPKSLDQNPYTPQVQTNQGTDNRSTEKTLVIEGSLPPTAPTVLLACCSWG